MNRRFALILAILAPLSLPAVASEGWIPIFEALTLDTSQGQVGGKYVVTRNNAIENTGDSGILVNFNNDSGADEVAEGSIVDNSIRDAGTSAVLPKGGRGIEVRFGISSVVIQDNRIERPESYGLTVNSRGAVVISGNRVNETGYRGIIASRTSACRISNNVVRDAGVLMDADENRGGDGIFINETASNCLVVDNVSTHNGMSGLRVEGLRSHIERNVLNSNTKAGLHFEETSTGLTGRLRRRFGQHLVWRQSGSGPSALLIFQQGDRR